VTVTRERYDAEADGLEYVDVGEAEAMLADEKSEFDILLDHLGMEDRR
jgi:hypothetical protein